MEAKIEKKHTHTHTLSKTTEYLKKKKKENGLQIFSKTMTMPPRLCVPDLLNEGRGLIMKKKHKKIIALFYVVCLPFSFLVAHPTRKCIRDINVGFSIFL